MTAEFQLEMERKVQESLADTPYACTELAKLSGGIANFVYRGTLVTPLEDGSDTVVVKHTEAFSASNSGFKLPDSRCDYEQAILQALEHFPAVEHEGMRIHTPRMHHFSLETHTQIYSDLPSSSDLKTYVLAHSQSLSASQCQPLGFAIGLWLAKFHAWGQQAEQRALVQKMLGNAEMKQLKWTINFQMLVRTIPNFPEILGGDKEVFERLAAEMKGELESGKGILIHGDFWSGNIILPSTLLETGAQSPTQLLVLDWELSQISSPAYDLGQMLAELFFFSHFKGIPAGLSLMNAFLEGYQSVSAGVAQATDSKMDKVLALKTAIQTGVHLVSWGSRIPGWGTEKQVEDLVRIGRNWVVWGAEGDVEKFRGGPLAGLFA